MAKIVMPKSEFILSCIACRKNETVFLNFLSQDFGWKSCINEKKTHEEHWSGKFSKIIKNISQIFLPELHPSNFIASLIP